MTTPRTFPPQLAGKTAAQIAAVLVARRVDRIIADHLDRPSAVRRAKAVQAVLTLPRRDPFKARGRNG